MGFTLHGSRPGIGPVSPLVEGYICIYVTLVSLRNI